MCKSSVQWFKTVHHFVQALHCQNKDFKMAQSKINKRCSWISNVLFTTTCLVLVYFSQTEGSPLVYPNRFSFQKTTSTTTAVPMYAKFIILLVVVVLLVLTHLCMWECARTKYPFATYSRKLESTKWCMIDNHCMFLWHSIFIMIIIFAGITVAAQSQISKQHTVKVSDMILPHGRLELFN